MYNFKAIIEESVIRGGRKNVSQFNNGQIIVLYQGKKSFKKIAEITCFGLCTVQRIIKSWKGVNEPLSSSQNNCDQKMIVNNRDQKSLKRLVKYNRQKSNLEIENSFDKESKTIYTRTMRRELKGMKLKSCSAARKSLVNVTEPKKETAICKRIEVGPLSNNNKSCGQMIPYLLSSNMRIGLGLFYFKDCL
ncbi:hypothetical protein AVEN_63758-1 [Araneus ventricosus]|uniref:Transposase Tc1-like domain-containing protein n=1 Tax=Araneus ventricosus TaxID=182803 RepID=A0A4Y2KS72_ARAVE|nr:hypothetical protein AVEN_63758-1 [Araneus ventricosus]